LTTGKTCGILFSAIENYLSERSEMEMAELMELIKQRQGDMSIEEFANKMGTRAATLYRQYNGERQLGIDALRRYAAYFRDQGDDEMIHALKSYALGFESDKVPS
jgi:predicted transcriptional regulator